MISSVVLDFFMLMYAHHRITSMAFITATSSITLAFILFLFVGQSVCTNDDPSLYPGHLEPLGARHNKSSVKTLFAFPGPREFFQKFVTASIPLLIIGGAKLSPAFAKWTDEYFMSVPDSNNVLIDVEDGKKENRTKRDLQRMSFKQFVGSYRDQDVYMVHVAPKFIQ